MHPFLFHVGTTGIRAYGVFSTLGYLLAGAYLWRYREEMGLSKGETFDLALAIIAGALIGGKLGGLLFYYHGPWLGLRTVWFGGLSFYQGFWGSVLATYIYVRWHGKTAAWVADRAAVAVPLGHAVGRFGCFLNGCCFGKPTTLPWGVVFDAGGRVPQKYLGVRLHPNQLYELAGTLFLAAVFHQVLKRKPKPLPDGSLFCLYIIGYALYRFCLEPLRGDDPGSIAWFLSTAQWIAVAHVAFGIYFLARLRRLAAEAAI